MQFTFTLQFVFDDMTQYLVSFEHFIFTGIKF